MGIQTLEYDDKEITLSRQWNGQPLAADIPRYLPANDKSEIILCVFKIHISIIIIHEIYLLFYSGSPAPLDNYHLNIKVKLFYIYYLSKQ